jgi:hypothetical protein
VIAGVCDGLRDSRRVGGIGVGVRFGGLGVTGGSDHDRSTPSGWNGSGRVGDVSDIRES